MTKTQQVKFLGHIYSDKGIEVDPEKVTMILSFKVPKNNEETRSCLGLVTYVDKFIPDLSNPEFQRRLLPNEINFNWKEAEEKAFEDLMKLRSKQ